MTHTESAAPAAALAREFRSYGKPVAPTAIPTSVEGFELDCHRSGELTATSTGAVIHRTDRAPLLVVTDVYTYGGRTPATYRDETVVPFFTYYTSVERVELFGPDIDAELAI